MKKTSLLFLLFFLFSTAFLFAQKHTQTDHESFFRIGGKAGININKINGQSYKTGFNYNYLLGGFVQFNFGRLGFQPEVNLVQSSYEFSNDANDIYNDLLSGGGQKKARLNYVKVPLLLNINVGESKHVKIQLGPQYGGLLKQVVDSVRANRTFFKSSTFSILGGVWFQLPFINLGARYELGLTNVKDVVNNEKWKSQAYNIFIGFTF